LPLGSAFTRYLSDEILALLPNAVKRFFETIFTPPPARAISRRGIEFPDERIVVKIFAHGAESAAKKIQFPRARLF